MIAKWSSFADRTLPVCESPTASMRTERASVSVSMTHLSLRGWRRVLHCRDADPAERIFDTFARLRARGQRVEASPDELRGVSRRERPLIREVHLVQRDDGWNITGSR